MSKIRKIDFVISEEDEERLVFRFYPKQSSCHSFYDKPPKTWDEVYKVYYAYAILQQYKSESDGSWETEIVFQCECDECSIIDSVGFACKELANGKTKKIFEHSGNQHIWNYLDEEMRTNGDGVDWTIHKYDNQLICDKLPGIKYQEYYEFILWEWYSTGYKFTLQANQLREFGKYLEQCCEYMLAHGDPI